MNIFEVFQFNFLEQFDLFKYIFLLNIVGVSIVEEVVWIVRLVKVLGFCDMIKVEVIGCSCFLLFDFVEILKVFEQFFEEGFIVLLYMLDDVVLVRKLEEFGVYVIMLGVFLIGLG